MKKRRVNNRPMLAAFILCVQDYYFPPADKRKKTQQEPQEEQVTAELVGNDKDEHGCIGSAGYTWSGTAKLHPSFFGVRYTFSNRR